MVIIAVQQSGIDGPLDHVVAIVEQETAELHVSALFRFCNHGEVEENEQSHEASCLQSHGSAFQLVALQADQSGEFQFAVALLEQPDEAFHSVFNRRKRGHPALRHADIDIE